MMVNCYYLLGVELETPTKRSFQIHMIFNIYFRIRKFHLISFIFKKGKRIEIRIQL